MYTTGEGGKTRHKNGESPRNSACVGRREAQSAARASEATEENGREETPLPACRWVLAAASGRSESRAGLRDFFEVDAKHIGFGTLVELLREKKIEASVVKKAMQEWNINPEKPNPANS
ncbi:MAG: hypothetical protein M1453_04075 [Acidobacteria bacterium]|nr:hypothetical protein [Acidobacteriota bacterium]MCL5287157.1 hypothetical protein [Acidobacteriota bacterium]